MNLGVVREGFLDEIMFELNLKVLRFLGVNQAWKDKKGIPGRKESGKKGKEGKDYKEDFIHQMRHTLLEVAYTTSAALL